MMASVDEFLRTGRLGPLHEGLSRDEVCGVLGPHEDISDEKRFPEIWKYGSLQLVFHKLPGDADPFLVSMTLSFYDPEAHSPRTLDLVGWTPTCDTTPTEFRAHVAAEGIPLHGEVEAGENQHLIVGAGVRITFDEGRLYSIAFTSKREPRIKQVTVNIASSALEEIRKEAAAQGISVSALCSRWIGERVSSHQPQ